MDLALTYNPEIGMLDIALDGADLRAEDTLASAVMLSLLSDRTAQAHEVDAGGDRRGWWADAFADVEGDAFGSRLWLLGRNKQLPGVVQLARAYIAEALQWLIADGLAESLEVTAFIPRAGWLYVDVVLTLRAGNRRFRFEWNDESLAWRLATERYTEVQ
jgi:phage gp46-like protein